MGRFTILFQHERVIILLVVNDLYLDLCLIGLRLFWGSITLPTARSATIVYDTTAYKKQGRADQNANKDGCISVALACIFQALGVLLPAVMSATLVPVVGISVVAGVGVQSKAQIRRIRVAHIVASCVCVVDTSRGRPVGTSTT